MFRFAPRQAEVIEILHEAWVNGTPEIGQAYVLTRIGSPIGRMRDLFKGHHAWGALIVPGIGKGTFRLNIPR